MGTLGNMRGKIRGITTPPGQNPINETFQSEILLWILVGGKKILYLGIYSPRLQSPLGKFEGILGVEIPNSPKNVSRHPGGDCYSHNSGVFLKKSGVPFLPSFWFSENGMSPNGCFQK